MSSYYVIIKTQDDNFLTETIQSKEKPTTEIKNNVLGPFQTKEEANTQSFFILNARMYSKYMRKQ